MLAAMESDPQVGQLEQCQQLARALLLTRQMLSHAENGEWEEVAELDKQRRDDLLACFSGEIQPADSELVAEAIAALLHLNEELMSKLQADRDLVMEQGASLSRNRNAVGSYREIGAVKE